MKNSFLALAAAAVATLAISSSASAVTIYDKDGTTAELYGRVHAHFGSNKSGEATVNGDSSKASFSTSARLGLNLRTELTSGIAGIARAEWEMPNGNNTDVEYAGVQARYLWVGADFGNAGLVKVGKFEPAIKYAISQTDIYEDAGCTGLAGNDDRREGVVQYEWSGYGVDAILSYAFAKNGEHVDGAYHARVCLLFLQ